MHRNWIREHSGRIAGIVLAACMLPVGNAETSGSAAPVRSTDTPSPVGSDQAEADAAIREAVIDALSEDPQLDLVDLDVTVDRGTISLSGHAPTSAQKHLAARYADDVAGSQGVVNLIKVIPGMEPSGAGD